MLEKYYSVNEIAAQLNLSKAFVREQFKGEPGVLRIGQRGRRAKRDYLTIRIPQSVLDAFIAKQSNPQISVEPRRRREAVGVNA